MRGVLHRNRVDAVAFVRGSEALVFEDLHGRIGVSIAALQQALDGPRREAMLTCPKWPPHPEHMISTRTIPILVSVFVTTAPSTILSKAGHPHPESNLA